MADASPVEASPAVVAPSNAATLSDAELSAVRALINAGDLAVLTVKSVLASLVATFGEAALEGKRETLKQVIKEEAGRRAAAEAAHADNKDGVEEEEEEEEEAPPRKPASKKRKSKAPESSVASKSAHLDDIPTNIEVEMDPNDYLRRNPGRAGRRVTAPPPKAKKRAPKADGDGASAKKRGGGFAKPVMVDEELAQETLLPRTQVVKHLTAYIKEKKLQDPKDGRKIVFDEPLAVIFKRKTSTFFKLQKLLSENKLVYDPSEVVESDPEEEDQVEEGDGADGQPQAHAEQAHGEHPPQDDK